MHRLLHQGFTTGEMGFRGQFARHKSFVVHVRFGSKADILDGLRDVRFTPKSGHCWTTVGCPLCANSRHRDALIDHLVGAGEQRWWHFEAERLGGS